MREHSTLFPRQKALLEEIRRFTRERGFPPTLRELARALHVRSASGIRQQLAALERKGYLKREAGKPRGLVLIGVEDQDSIPIVGLVAAGSPIDVAHVERGRLSLDLSLGITGHRCFAVEVEGESMIGAHIVRGDYVVLDPAMEPRNGQVVAAAVDGAVTLKSFYRTPDGVELRPANPKMLPIKVQDGAVHDARIIGVAVAMVRRLGAA